jgi:ribosomal protein L37E
MGRKSKPEGWKCSVCGEEKDHVAKDMCRACYQRNHYRINPESHKKRPEKNKQFWINWTENNPEKLKEKRIKDKLNRITISNNFYWIPSCTGEKRDCLENIKKLRKMVRGIKNDIRN